MMIPRTSLSTDDANDRGRKCLCGSHLRANEALGCDIKVDTNQEAAPCPLTPVEIIVRSKQYHLLSNKIT